MKENTFVNIKKILYALIVAVLFVIFVLLLIKTRYSQIVKDIKEFIKADTKVLYMSDKENYSDYPIELLSKYEVDYLYVNSTNLNKFEKSKIEDMVNSKYLSNIVIIFKNGKIVDAIVDFESEEKLNIFLKKYDIIPNTITDITGIIDEVKELLLTDFSLLYIPYVESDEEENQDKILSSICKDYNINYKKIDAYLLSYKQKEKLNSILQISFVEDQIVILVKNEKILSSIRGINKKNVYLNKLYENKFIDEIGDYINYINYEDFKDKLNDSNKNIIIIGKNECKYCNEVIEVLNPIIIDYDITINYLNIDSLDSELSTKVENKLLELGYNDGFTTPITIIVENNKLLDYVIGTSTEQYFIDIFKENGIIK